VSDFDRFCQAQEVQLTRLAEKFADYAPPGGVDRAHVRRWLSQFGSRHWGLGLKLAQLILYYSTDKIHGLMTKLRAVISEQIKSEGVSEKEVYYVAFGRPGESGEDILRRFRLANKLDPARNQFINALEIPEILMKNPDPVLFFLDDFVGTGKQVADGWRDPNEKSSTLNQIVPKHLRLYLAVVAGTAEGAKRIEKETSFRVILLHTIGPKRELMAAANTSLSDKEKRTLKRYCEKAGNQPLGFGDKGLLVSFAYGTPNNTLSVVRGSKKQRPWVGLLPPWGDL